MDRVYDLYEQAPKCYPYWRGRACGLREVHLKLRAISQTTANECFAMYLPTKQIVARVNDSPAKAARLIAR